MNNRATLQIIEDRQFLTSTPEKSVRAIASAMKENHEAAVLVVSPDDGRLIGICTERDLAFKVLAPGLDANTTTVGEIMTGTPQSIEPDKPFSHALHLMYEGGFRHMPVVLPDGRPIGVISARDALGLEMHDFRQELEKREELSVIL